MGKSKNGKIKKWEKYLKIGEKWEKFHNKKHCNNYRKIRILISIDDKKIEKKSKIKKLKKKQNKKVKN